MLKALEERKREREEAIEKVKKYFTHLSKSIELRAGILYGSYARGDFNTGSDIDIIVVAVELPGHPIERSELLYSCVMGGMEPKGYTPAEFERLVDRKTPFARELLAEGIAILDDGYWATMKERL